MEKDPIITRESEELVKVCSIKDLRTKMLKEDKIQISKTKPIRISYDLGMRQHNALKERLRLEENNRVSLQEKFGKWE